MCVATSAALPSLAHQREEFGEHAVGGRLVEIAGRLVGEHQQRAVGERAGDRDALLLAARQLARPVVRRWARPSWPSRSAARSSRLGLLGAVDELRQHDILDRVEIGQQMVELVDEAERVAAQRGAAVVVERRAPPAPSMRIDPSNPPSSRPTACSMVDLPEPDGPSSATISPALHDAQVDAAQHVDRRHRPA